MLEHPAASAAASEAVILARWDAGQSIEAIVADTRYSRRRVETVVEIFHAGPSERELAAARALPLANQEFVARLLALQARSAAERESEMRRQSARSDQETREINDALTNNIERLCKELLPNGSKEGHEYVAANIHDGGKSRSLSVNIGPGHMRGVWVDFAHREHKGRPLALICQVACAGNWAEAYAWAREWLGWPDPRAAAEADPEVRARIAAEREARREKMERDRLQREAQAAEEREKIRKSAVARWQEAAVLASGDPVVAYLAARGIDLGALYARTGQRPGAIRFNPSLQYGRSDPGKPAPYRGPAMVSMVTALDGAHIATHRTWLDPERPAKAPRELLGGDAKKVLGAYLGGHIPIWKGSSKAPLKDIPEGMDVYVAEGVEDGLTAACAKPELRVIAGISVGNLTELELPPQMGRLIILKQNDPPGSDAERAVMAAAAAHRERGRRVAFVRAPQGVKDLNELAQREGGI